MTQRPIFVATHPRACSTAFERVFMTQRDTLHCFHEPFGEAFYYGPERMGERYEPDEKTRVGSGHSKTTFKSTFDEIDRQSSENKRVFIKDMSYYLVPPDGKPASIAPSLSPKKKGVGTPSTVNEGKANGDGEAGTHPGAPYPYATEAEPGNPTVIPTEILQKFHFAFLIRHPSKSVPSFWRCASAPLSEVTGFDDYLPNEAGYIELRRMFDYLKDIGQVGPAIADRDDNVVANGSSVNGSSVNGGGRSNVEICVIDADDLLDYPAEMIEKFCKSVGIEFDPSMLKWGDEVSQRQAVEAFEKWRGFHDDAINSTELRERAHKHKMKSMDEEHAGWKTKFGPKAADAIRQSAEANLTDYNYLKQFAIKVGPQA